MKNNKLKIYLVVTLLLVMGIGYAYLNQNIELDNSVTISSYEKQGVPAPYDITILSGQKGNLQAGDKIRIGQSEDFYVISSDNSENGKTVLFAKYNLLVGNNLENFNITGQIPSNTSGYGLQSVDATGYVDNTYGTFKGTVAFATTKYWLDGNNLLISPYNANGTSNNPYPYVYDSNSTIYQYISGENGYVNRLKEMGAPSTISGRLLSYEEADATKSVEDNGKSIIFDGHQTYWLGSLYSNNDLWEVRSYYTNFSNNNYYYENQYGIRPVIEINTSDI